MGSLFTLADEYIFQKEQAIRLNMLNFSEFFLHTFFTAICT